LIAIEIIARPRRIQKCVSASARGPRGLSLQPPPSARSSMWSRRA
jgi:hypothetical protein